MIFLRGRFPGRLWALTPPALGWRSDLGAAHAADGLAAGDAMPASSRSGFSLVLPHISFAQGNFHEINAEICVHILQVMHGAPWW
jgi:hypothetical protein